jgi:peptidoglycan/LPS O-acetylase OafA/YrhL
MSERALRTDYVPGIEGLRAVAVLSVLLYHLNDALLPGGFTGVDVFFVISGYVIAGSLQADSAASLGAFILGFYKRRILRLVPALLFFLIPASFACALFIPDSWLSAGNNETALWAFFGVSNFFLLYSADGYFSLRVPYNPFSHTWTLAVEEQFYMLFPFVFYLWLKRKAIWLLPVLALASLFVAAYQTSASPLAAFYLLPSRFWELAAGALLFQAQSRRLPWTPWLWPVGLTLLAVGFLFAGSASFPFPWALAPVAGTVLLIMGLCDRSGARGPIQAVLESGFLTYIGRISYSLYLWHWGIFVLFRWTVGISEPVTAGAALLLTFLLSALSYHFVEQPFRRGAFWRRQPSWRIAGAGVAAVVVAHLGVASLYETRNGLGLNQSITTNQYDWSPYISRPASGPGKRLFVIGDSHAETYGNMAYLAAQRQGAQVAIYSRVGCPIANLRTTVVHTPPCRHIEEDVVSYLQVNAKPGDAVLIASLRVPRLSEQSNAFDLEAQRRLWRHPARSAERKQALEEAARFIEKLQAMQLHVILDAPKPLFRAPPFRCLDWFNRSNPACSAGFEISRELLLELREPVMASLRELERSHGVYVWDPFPTLCPGPKCSALHGQRPVFFDTDHLSGYGGRLLVDSFSAALAQVWKREPAART